MSATLISLSTLFFCSRAIFLRMMESALVLKAATSPSVNKSLAINSSRSLSVARLLKWKAALPSHQLHFHFSVNVAPVDRARNNIVDVFLKTRLSDGSFLTHLLMIDSDTIPEEDAVERLLWVILHC